MRLSQQLQASQRGRDYSTSPGAPNGGVGHIPILEAPNSVFLNLLGALGLERP